MYKKLHIHFIGIGGIGMSGIAEVLLNSGYPVSGSDLKRSATTQRLSKKGAKIFIGHRSGNVKDANVVVYSSAVSQSNPELVAATKEGIPTIRRAEMLAELMRLTKYGVAIAGTHGKTTTTSLLGAILHAGKLDPTLIIGGKVNSLRGNTRLGKGDFMVVEADESDGSFLYLTPTIATVTNIDPDHLENFEDFSDYKNSFYRFCEKIPFYGLVVLCGEHSETKKLAKQLDKRISLYGFSKKHQWNAQNIRFVHTQSFFDLYEYDNKVEHIELNLPGRHNILNALSAIAIARELNVPIKKIKEALKKFKGVRRRMDVLYKANGMVVIDDYAHHPKEIQATLQAAKKAFTGRIVALFQPHRYSRLKALYKDFKTSFDFADVVFLDDVYPAGEKPIRGYNSEKLAKDLLKKKETYYFQKQTTLKKKILQYLQPGDIFMSLGAGDVTKIGQDIAKDLKEKFKD